MIWLASFPRSGNTFFRNVLFEVYGLESSTYHRESDYPVDDDYNQYPFVKTHELPAVLEKDGVFDQGPIVYLVRDGRDAMCSISHHRSNLIAPGSDYLQNMREAILAERGSFFGGWSENVAAWCRRADLVIRFEDLTRDPIGTVERLRAICDLPEPRREKLPTFESLKAGVPKYGAKRSLDISESEKQDHADQFFRRGKAGGWRDEMPETMQELFWSIHGDTMDALGYAYDGQLREPHPDVDYVLRSKLGLPAVTSEKRYRVLMEADKLASTDNDGVKRYQVELLKHLFPVVTHPDTRWEIDLYIRGRIRPLIDCKALLFHSFSRGDLGDAGLGAEEVPGESTGAIASSKNTSEFEAISKGLVPEPGLVLRMEKALVSLAPKRFISFLQARKITFFHDSYDWVRSGIERCYDFLDESRDRLTGASSKFRRAISGTSFRDSPAGYDLIHIPLKQNFRYFRAVDTRKLITFHDLTHLHFPEYHTPKNIQNAKRGVNFAVASDADIIAVSQATRADVVGDLKIPASRVHLIHEAADPMMFSVKANSSDCWTVRHKYGLRFQGPYIVCLSTLEPRKNLENTIRAFLALVEDHPDLDISLVIAGKRGWDADGIYALAKKAKGRVFFTGFVDDKDLAYLFSDALCLSYLSFYEGFGLPLLEAMRCGTPVVFGNNSSMIEVAGEGGLPANPADLEDIKRQFLALCTDPELRKEKSLAALRQANQFSWRQTAIQTLDLYRELIDESD